jgi:hypothetical protein
MLSLMARQFNLHTGEGSVQILLSLSGMTPGPLGSPSTPLVSTHQGPSGQSRLPFGIPIIRRVENARRCEEITQWVRELQGEEGIVSSMGGAWFEKADSNYS